MRSTLPSPFKVIEGQTATLECTVTAANPNTGITWKWFKTDSPNNVLHNEPNYTIPNIQRGRSGSYSCTASNTVGTSEAATVYVNVQCKWLHILQLTLNITKVCKCRDGTDIFSSLNMWNALLLNISFKDNVLFKESLNMLISWIFNFCSCQSYIENTTYRTR